MLVLNYTIKYSLQSTYMKVKFIWPVFYSKRGKTEA